MNENEIPPLNIGNLIREQLRPHRLSPIVLRVALDVNNLLSQDYDVIINYPMPKRNYKCTVSITY